MMQYLPWALTVLLIVAILFLLSVIRLTIAREVKVANCLALILIQQKTYQNHRIEFLAWLDSEGIIGNDFQSAVRANKAAQELAVSFIDKLNAPPAYPLMAVLAEYKTQQPRKSK